MDIVEIEGLDEELKDEKGRSFGMPGPENETVHPTLRDWLYMLANAGVDDNVVDKLARFKTGQKIEKANGKLLLAESEVKMLCGASGAKGMAVPFCGAIHKVLGRE